MCYCNALQLWKFFFTVKCQNGMISLYANIQTGNRKAWLSNMDILKQLAEELNIRVEQVQATVQLIDEGNTIPFIARYRKEVTGSLDDEVLRNLDERLTYLRNLEEKKNQVLSSIEEQGKLTDELREQILAAKTLVVVEDLYRPYRPKRKTRASVAKEKGLEPLAELLLQQELTVSALEAAEAYIDEEKGVNTAAEALQGAKDIIAESILKYFSYEKNISEINKYPFNLEGDVYIAHYNISDMLATIIKKYIWGVAGKIDFDEFGAVLK